MRKNNAGWVGWLFLFSAFVYSLAAAPDKLEDERNFQITLQFHLAESLEKDGKLAEALLIYNDFLELYPQSDFRWKALEAKARIFKISHRYQKAVSVYKKLADMTLFSEKGLEYLFEQASLYEKTGFPVKAEKLYKRIIETNPNSPIAEKSRIRLNVQTLLSDTASACANCVEK